MAAGAPRHRAPRRTWGRTGDFLQALGVAGGGVLALTVLTVLAGGPAAPDPVRDASPPAIAAAAAAAKVSVSAADAVARTKPTVRSAATALIWHVGGPGRLRPVGPTVIGSQDGPPPPSTTASAPVPTPSPRARVQLPPMTHPTPPTPRPTPTPTPTETPIPTPTPDPTTPAPGSPVVPTPAQPAPGESPIG